jgi:hypothetical protein
MSDDSKRRLNSVVQSIQQQYGPQALQRGDNLKRQRYIPHVVTGFGELDSITGCGGIPLGAISLISGRSTSGKLTLAYKILANAQHLEGRTKQVANVGLIDLNQTADPDYMVRCGIDLSHLLIVRPPVGKVAVEVLGDLVRHPNLRVLVVHSLADLATQPQSLAVFHSMLIRLRQMLHVSGCALVLLDEMYAPWLRWFNLDRSYQVRRACDLHIEMRRERWLHNNNQLIGYRARAQVLKSLWVKFTNSATVDIVFNGTIKAAQTW